MSIAQPFLPLFNRSWTFEGWIYLFHITNGGIYPIVGQGESQAPDKYLHLAVLALKLRLGFFGDDLDSAANLTTSRWYHFAFVFDSATRNQSIYLDGVLDVSRQANSSYLGSTGALDIGFAQWYGINYYFDGLIDQLSYTNRSKAPGEIFFDATLTLYISFDGNSIRDQGPLQINGSLQGSTAFVSGRRGQALQICNVPDSYLTVGGLVLLGRNNQPYSFSIWIKPVVIQKSTVIQMSSDSDGNGGWYFPMIGLNSAGQLAIYSWSNAVMQVMGPVVSANSWTHVVSTYSPNHGLRLYVNGSLYNSSPPFAFVASGVSNYLLVGSPHMGTFCAVCGYFNGQYSGAIDELRVYSRELGADEINILANP